MSPLVIYALVTPGWNWLGGPGLILFGGQTVLLAYSWVVPGLGALVGFGKLPLSESGWVAWLASVSIVLAGFR